MITQNSIPDLCELEVRLVGDLETDDDVYCVIDLRVHKGEIPLGDEECEVCFQKITVSVDLGGLSIVPGSRFGEPKKNNAVALKRISTEIDKRKKIAGLSFLAKATTSSVEGNAEFRSGLSSSNERESKLESTECEEHYRVRARPNQRWEVIEPDGSALDGTYLEDELLFQMSRVAGSNMETISIDVKVKQRDLQINQMVFTQSAVKFFSGLSKTQRRLIDIFIAKSLSSKLYDGKCYLGELVLSTYEFINED